MSEDSFNDSDFDGGYDALFGGDKLVGLFNKTHGVGTTRSGVITKAPETRQSTFIGTRKPKWWDAEAGKPTEVQYGPDGKSRRPLNDEVFVLQTEYRMNEHELKNLDLDEDSGVRGVFASGDLFRAIRDAIRKSKARDRHALVGMTLTLTRTGTKKKGDFDAWTWDAKLSGTPAAPKPTSVFDE